jgi:hypothetical protein
MTAAIIAISPLALEKKLSPFSLKLYRAFASRQYGCPMLTFVAGVESALPTPPIFTCFLLILHDGSNSTNAWKQP